MHHGVGQVELGLGQPDELDGPGGGVGDHERQRVGHADVLAGEDHQAPGDEAGVLPGLEHAGEPVEAGVGVGAPDALDEGGDDVVVVVAPVAEGLGAEGGLDVADRDPHPLVDDGAGVVALGVGVLVGQGDRHLEAGEHVAAVAVGPLDEQGEGLVVDVGALGLEAPAHQAGDGLEARAARAGTASSGSAAAG